MHHRLAPGYYCVLLSIGLVLALAGTAGAATPGTWQRLPQSTASEQGAQPWPLRLTDGSLDVAYSIRSADGTRPQSLLTALISGGATITAGPPIATSWATISNPALISSPSGVGAFFGGIHSTDPADLNTDLNFAAAPGAAGPWTVAPGSASQPDSGDQAYASDTSAITLPDGTPIEAWAHTLGVTVHRGVGGAAPNQDFQAALGGCCGYDAALALEGSTGLPAVTWFSNATGHIGYYEQAVNPATGAPVAGPTLVPGSQVAGNADSPRARVAFTGRAGRPGLFVALAAGYPEANRVIVWRVGAAAPLTVSGGPGGVRNVSIAADPLGRLWVTWTRPQGGVFSLFASRSNPDGTAFETPVKLSPPPGAQDSFALASSAQEKVLDVLGTFGAPIAIWATQVQPGEDVRADPVTVKSGAPAVVTVRVTDAGVPLGGALVTAEPRGGASAAKKRRAKRPIKARTNSAGVARLRLGRLRRSTTVNIRVSKAGFAPRVSTVRVKVKRARRRR